MKLTKLSLVAVLAVSSAFAGGDIEPVVTPVVEEVVSNTTINGKLTGYYYTDDTVDLFDEGSSALGTAVTLDVTHKFTDNIAMNFSAIGFANVIDESYLMENEKSGAFINVANITATFMDTTFILGRQLLDTPMLGGFDWLLAPGSFEAYTVANNSIENLTLVASYVRTWRMNNTGNTWNNLTSDSDMQDLTGDITAQGGDNWTLGAAYDNKTISGSVWYYNVDALDYTQVYADAGYNFEVAKIEAQYANTNYDTTVDSDAYGIKASATLSGFNLMAAYVNVSDEITGFIGRDSLYTSSWNTFAATTLGDSFKIEAGGEFAGLTASISYAYYEYEQNVINNVNNSDDGSEIDVILGYNITDNIDINAVYTNTDWGDDLDSVNALEIYANYKF